MIKSKESNFKLPALDGSQLTVWFVEYHDGRIHCVVWSHDDGQKWVYSTAQ